MQHTCTHPTHTLYTIVDGQPSWVSVHVCRLRGRRGITRPACIPEAVRVFLLISVQRLGEQTLPHLSSHLWHCAPRPRHKEEMNRDHTKLGMKTAQAGSERYGDVQVAVLPAGLWGTLVRWEQPNFKHQSCLHN